VQAQEHVVANLLPVMELHACREIKKLKSGAKMESQLNLFKTSSSTHAIPAKKI